MITESLQHIKLEHGTATDDCKKKERSERVRKVRERKEAERLEQQQNEEKRRLDRREHRRKVIEEVLQTERDYLESICLCLDIFLEDNTEKV